MSGDVPAAAADFDYISMLHASGMPTPHCNDVPEANIYFRFVQRIRDLGITAGCSVNPPLFCPDASITQGQMAVFMIAVVDAGE